MQVDNLTEPCASAEHQEWSAGQFMENWCYDYPTLMSFAKHYESGEPLPKDLFDKLKAARCALSAYLPRVCLQVLRIGMSSHAVNAPRSAANVSHGSLQTQSHQGALDGDARAGRTRRRR
jgi:Zn-dependent oligopeptidase